MTYTTRKLENGETMGEIKLGEKKSLVWQAPGGRNYAVVDENGNVVFTKNEATGKWQAENYPQRGTAKMQAAWLERHPEVERRTFSD